jgi:starch synthase
MASLLPLYLREFYKEEPLFTESKIVTSLYNSGFEGELNSDLAAKVKFDLSKNDKIATIEIPNHTNILKSAIENSDAIIHGSEMISEELSSFIEEKEMPALAYESENLKESYMNFYADLLSVN